MKSPKVLWEDVGGCVAFFNDGTIGVSDGVGYIDTVDKEAVMALYNKMKEHFSKESV